MIDPISYFTGAAIASGAIEAGKWVAKSALSGLVGNSFNTVVWRAIPEIHAWYRGEGQPANHHLQRALRTAYLAAPGQLLERARNEASQASKSIDDDSALDALQELRSRSLVDVVDREKLRCRLHSLIRAEAGQESALQERHAEAVARRFESWEESWRECEEHLDDWRLALSWAADERSPPSGRIGLLRVLASSGFLFAYRRGLMADALHAIEVAEAEFENLGDRAGLQASYGNQALILRAWGRLEDALDLLRKTEDICRELGLRNSLRISLLNQAILLDEMGQPDEASRLRAESETIHTEMMRGREASA